MKRRTIPIRARITLGSLLIAAIVLSGVAVILHVQISSTTFASEQTLARSDLDPFVSDLKNNPTERPDSPARGVLVAVRAADGAFLIDTLPDDLKKNLADRDIHERSGAAPPGRQRTGEAPTRRVTSGGTTYVVVEDHIDTGGGGFTLWAARSTTSGDLTASTLERSVIIGLLVALAAFGIAAWVLASIALRPVARMTASAELLSRGGTHAGLPVPSARDELSLLARTLNAFIGRLRAGADRERQMISDASHELRTPLAALTARLELAHRSFGDADALEREILAAQQSVARLSALATTLLELARLDDTDSAALTDGTSTGTELRGELLDAVDRVRAMPGSGDVGVVFDVDALGEPDSEYALPRASFGRLAENLLTNAVAFSPEGTVVVAVLARDAAGGLVLTVTDDGPGLPIDFAPLAFDRFTRADESRRRIRGGSGLGLALVKGIAERAGGHALLMNRVGHGAVATVILPKM